MPAAPISALTKAMNLLAIRGYSCQELRNKLRASKYSESEIDMAVNECVRRHYIDEEQLKSDLIELYRTRNYGAVKIASLLRKKGFSTDDLPINLNDGEAEKNTAIAAMQAKLRLLPRETDGRKKRDKVIRYLLGKGFVPELVFDIVNDYSFDNE